jgi:CheY-like chemotaxis protein
MEALVTHNYLKGRRLSGMSVLLVEDDQDARELVTMLLENDGATVAPFETAPVALDAMNHLMPDALIVDIGLPEYNGYAFIGRVRKLDDPHKRNIPAIALTAFGTTTDRDTALTSGFQTFVTKPFDADKLVETIASVVSQKRSAA